MAYAPPLGECQLGGADVHAAVELHRVGVDDLAPEGVRDTDGEVALACGGRPDQDDDARALCGREWRHRASVSYH